MILIDIFVVLSKLFALIKFIVTYDCDVNSHLFFMPPPFEECGRALSVAHVRPCVRACVRPCVRPSVRPFVHRLSGYFVSATPPTILSQSF